MAACKQTNREKIPGPRNVKEHYQSFITKRKTKTRNNYFYLVFIMLKNPISHL